MQGIKEFIQQDVLLPRLQKEGALVVYDPEERYRELCMKLGNGSVAVIDAGAAAFPQERSRWKHLIRSAIKRPVWMACRGMCRRLPPRPTRTNKKITLRFKQRGQCISR
mgnify:CR=1 FL=1